MLYKMNVKDFFFNLKHRNNSQFLLSSFRSFVNSFVFVCFVLRKSSQVQKMTTEMDTEYFNSSTISNLGLSLGLGESTTTEKPNSDILNDTIKTLQKVINDKDMPQLSFALLLTYLWIIYITFYNSRIIGYLVTKLVNKLFFRTAYFKIGLQLKGSS